MKLQLLKIDKLIDTGGIQYLEIPPGGIQIREVNKSLALRDKLILEIQTRRFLNVTRNIDFDVYYDSEIIPEGDETHALINLLAVEGLVNDIYKQLEEMKND